MPVAIDLSRSESSNSQHQYKSLFSSSLSSAEVREATELRQIECLNLTPTENNRESSIQCGNNKNFLLAHYLVALMNQCQLYGNSKSCP